MPKVQISRRATFSAAHRMYRDDLSESENQKLYGKCAHPNYHGHNYEIVVEIEGEIDTKTDMVMNLVDLQNVIDERVLKPMDHKNLNLDVSFLKGINPTAENLVVAIYRELARDLPSGLLKEVRLRETENNVAIFRGK